MLSAEYHAVCTEVVRILDTASRELDHSHEAARVSIQQAAFLLQTKVGGTRVTTVPRVRTRRGLLAWQARRVMEHVEQHLESSLSVAELGRLVNLSEAHFSRAFRRSFGEPPHAYVIRRRIGLATRLMLCSDAALSEIALKCGFNDQAHLSKQFRVLLGESPAAWRRSQRAADRSRSDQPEIFSARNRLGPGLRRELDENVLGV